MSLFATSIQHTDQRATLMGRMMRKLNVDIDRVAHAGMGSQIRSMASRCQGCKVADVCARWLDGEEGGCSHQDFCANASAFEVFRVAA